MFANNEHWVTLNWKEMLPNPSNAMPKKQGVQNRDKKENRNQLSYSPVLL